MVRKISDAELSALEQAKFKNVKALFAAPGGTFAVMRDDGSVICWGTRVPTLLEFFNLSLFCRPCISLFFSLHLVAST